MYYRVLTPDTIRENVKNMKKDVIEKLYAGRIGSAIIVDNSNAPKPTARIHYDYQWLKEKSAFEKQNAGKILVCLLLSESYRNEYLPYDPFEAKKKFQDNFKESTEHVLDKYCNLKKINKKELISYYRNIAEKNRSREDKRNDKSNKKYSTLNVLANAFLHITK